MTGSITIDYSIGDMYDEVSKKKTAFSTSMRAGVQADEPFLASLQFVDNAASLDVGENVICDDEASYETNHRGLRDQREGPSSPSTDGTHQTLIDVKARRQFFEDLSSSQVSTKETFASKKEQCEVVMVVTNENSLMNAVPLVIESQEEAVKEAADEEIVDEEAVNEEVPEEEAARGAEVMTSRNIRQNDEEAREVDVSAPNAMTSRIICEKEIEKAFSLDVSSAFGVYTAPIPQQEKEPQQEEDPRFVLALDESPRLVDVRVFETSIPKAPTYSDPVVINEVVEDGPANPSRCEAFAWAKDEATLLLVAFAGWVGLSSGANRDVQSEIRKNFGLTSAFEPKQASLMLKEMGGFFSEKEAATVKAENEAAADFNVATEAEELVHESFEVVESLTAGVATVIEPVAEEAMFMVNVMSESLTAN
jgi:hypothetical protein